MKRKKLVLVLTLILALLIAIVAFLFVKDRNDSQGVTDLYSDDTESFEIKTSYGSLYYPKKWENDIEIEISTVDDCEIIKFFAKTDNANQVQIFDIIFGGDGYTVGTITDDENNIINVNVVSYSVEDNVKDNDVFSMAEDVNYILQNLNKMENYTEL